MVTFGDNNMYCRIRFGCSEGRWAADAWTWWMMMMPIAGLLPWIQRWQTVLQLELSKC